MSMGSNTYKLVGVLEDAMGEDTKFVGEVSTVNKSDTPKDGRVGSHDCLNLDKLLLTIPSSKQRLIHVVDECKFFHLGDIDTKPRSS